MGFEPLISAFSFPSSQTIRRFHGLMQIKFSQMVDWLVYIQGIRRKAEFGKLNLKK
jgi:hypothetical protein